MQSIDDCLDQEFKVFIEAAAQVGYAIFALSTGYGHVMKATATEAAAYLLNQMLGINSNHLIILEDALGPVTRSIKDGWEKLYNRLSKQKDMKKYFEKVSANCSYPLEWFEEMLFAINSQEHRSHPPERQRFDAVISFYPWDRLVDWFRFTESGKNPIMIRGLPDIYMQTLYAVGKIKAFFAVQTEKLRNEILGGERRELDKKYAPEENKVHNTGLFVHPDNIFHNEGEIDKIVNAEKLPVMAHISGAGAQQEILLSFMENIDRNKIDLYMCAGDHRDFLEKVLKKGQDIGLIEQDELASAYSSFELGRIHRFRSGFQVGYNKDRLEACRLIESARKNYFVVAKCGDLTSGGVTGLLPPIGKQEYDNAEMALESKFVVLLAGDSLKGAADMGEKEYGKNAADRVNEMAGEQDRSTIRTLYRNLLNVNQEGCLNLAGLGLMAALYNAGETKSAEYLAKRLQAMLPKFDWISAYQALSNYQVSS